MPNPRHIVLSDRINRRISGRLEGETKGGLGENSPKHNGFLKTKQVEIACNSKFALQAGGTKCKVALVGGNWNNGTNAGLFNWNVNNTSSNANLNVGGRVLRLK